MSRPARWWSTSAAGTTEVAVLIPVLAIVYSRSVRVGGDKMDDSNHLLHAPQP